jgi:Poly A polymerase head domain
MLEQYSDILTAVRALCPSAHVGGGAVRDTLLERSIHDIDLFLSDDATEAATRVLRSKFGYVKVGDWESYEQFSDPAVVRLAKFEKADMAIPLCLIGLDKPRDMRENVERFDFGICEAAWDGSSVYTSSEYRTDLDNKTFTLCRADNQPQFNYSMKRFQNMTEHRYAGWKLVVPRSSKSWRATTPYGNFGIAMKEASRNIAIWCSCCYPRRPREVRKKSGKSSCEGIT